jgi:hypothetical protein
MKRSGRSSIASSGSSTGATTMGMDMATTTRGTTILATPTDRIRAGLVVTVLLLALGGAGCEREPASAREMAERAGVKNPTGDRIAEQVTTAVPRAGVQIELAGLRAAILTHQRMHDGQSPPSLDALETVSRLQFPDEYDYDPSAGTVRSRTFPDL